jgi:hypothetical protein
MTQVINDEDRTQWSLSTSGHGRTSTLCSDESETTGAHFRDVEESPNVNVSADEENIEPSLPRQSYEKLAQKNLNPLNTCQSHLGLP